MSKLTRLKVFDDGTVALGDVRNSQSLRIIEESSDRFFVALTAAGHVERGFFIPCLQATTAATLKDAEYVIAHRNRIKRNGLLGIWESDRLICKFLERVNQLDPLTSKNTKRISNINDKKVVLPQAVRYNDPYKNKKSFNPYPQIDEDEVKTADQYKDIDVLQKYIAPIRVNGELQFNRKIDFEDMIEDYMYINTLRYGTKDSSILSLYMQIHGEDNSLQVNYHPDKNILTWVHPVGQNTITVPVHELTKPWLDAYIEDQKKDKKAQQDEEWTSGRPVEKISTVDRFRQRAEARKKIQEERTKKSTHDDVM